MESMAINKQRELPSGSGISGSRLAPAARPWANLSPDLLLDVSSRLDDAADFARFHAVCMPWRAAAPTLHSPSATRPGFPAWLLALCDGRILRSTVDIRRVTSFEEEAGDGRRNDDNVRLAEPQAAAAAHGRNWVASADGTACWLFIASPEPRLVQLVTGVVVPLPRFSDHDDGASMMAAAMQSDDVRGIVYGDRTVFLYSFADNQQRTKSTFSAAILRPGDSEWTVMTRFLEVPAAGHRHSPSAAYRDGEVLICVGYFWSLFRPQSAGDMAAAAGLQSRWSKNEEAKYFRDYSYLLESRGELLWACVLRLKRDSNGGGDLASSLAVTVHALEKGAAGGTTRWVRRDGWSLADRVLFLGVPASFAADAHRLDVVGGRAYFVYRNCVFRYGLVDDEAHLVKRLQPRWGADDGANVWLPRQPTVSPIQEIRDKLEAKSL